MRQTSRNIMDLVREMQEQVLIVVEQCEASGYPILITATFRSLEDQDKLYAQGRTLPGKIVTNAKAMESWHNYGEAFDAVPLIGGKPMWDSDHPAWQVYGQAVKDAGLYWAGDWKSFRELPHAQLRPEPNPFKLLGVVECRRILKEIGAME